MEIQQWEVYDKSGVEDISKKQAMENLLQWMDENKTDRLITRTSILIAPGYRFRMIRGLVTNFHQPQSTLLLLIAAITGSAWKDIYAYALVQWFPVPELWRRIIA